MHNEGWSLTLYEIPSTINLVKKLSLLLQKDIGQIQRQVSVNLIYRSHQKEILGGGGRKMFEVAETESCTLHTPSLARLIFPNFYSGASSTELLNLQELCVLHMDMLVPKSKNVSGDHLKVPWHF